MRELCRNQYDFHVVNIIKRILNWFLGFDWRLRCAGLCATKTVLKQARVILITIFLVAIWLLTFWHSCTMQHKKKNGTKSKTELINSPCMFRLKYAALPCGTVFLFNNNHKAQANDVVCLRHFIYVNYFRTNKMVFRFVDLFTCSRQNIDMLLVCCACAIRWMEQKNSDGCNAKIPMQNLYMIWSILSAESFVRLQAVTIIGLLFNGKYTKVVIFFLLRRFVVFNKKYPIFFGCCVNELRKKCMT